MRLNPQTGYSFLDCTQFFLSTALSLPVVTFTSQGFPGDPFSNFVQILLLLTMTLFTLRIPFLFASKTSAKRVKNVRFVPPSPLCRGAVISSRTVPASLPREFERKEERK